MLSCLIMSIDLVYRSINNLSPQQLCSLFIFTIPAFYAQHEHDEQSETYPNEEEVDEAEFQAGEMIIEHITDAYEWHILSYGDFHFSLPLTVIVYNEGSLLTFMSSAFHHGHSPELFDENKELIHEIGPDQTVSFGLAVLPAGSHTAK